MSSSFLDSPVSRHRLGSPSTLDRDVVLSKCRSVIEALHSELEEERQRTERLERSLLSERQANRQLQDVLNVRNSQHENLISQHLLLRPEHDQVTRNLETLAAEHSKVLAAEQTLRQALAHKSAEVVSLQKTVVAISDELLKARTQPAPVWDEAKVERLRAKLEHKILTLKLKLNELLDHQEAAHKQLLRPPYSVI
jgi:hypothetical protein